MSGVLLQALEEPGPSLFPRLHEVESAVPHFLDGKPRQEVKGMAAIEHVACDRGTLQRQAAWLQTLSL